LPPQASVFLVQIGLVTRPGTLHGGTIPLLGGAKFIAFATNMGRAISPLDDVAP
jgi:hypothetical protein